MLFAFAIKPIIVFIKYMRPFNWYSPSPRQLCIRGVTGGEELQVSGYVRNRSCRITGHEAFRLLCVAPQQYIFSSLLTNRVSSAFPSCYLPFLPTILFLTSVARFDRAVMDIVPLLASLWYNGQLASAPPSSHTLKHVSAPCVPLLLMYLIFQMFNCSKISSLDCSVLSCFFSLLYQICRFMKVLLLPFGIADPPREGCSLSITQPFRVCTALAYKSSNLPIIEQILYTPHIESHKRRLAGQSIRTPS